MNNSVVGLDIAKNIFHFYSLGADTKVIKKSLKRAELLTFFANYPVSLIGIEACGGAHHWARDRVRRIPCHSYRVRWILCKVHRVWRISCHSHRVRDTF